MTAPTLTPQGWYVDPTGRHEYRYWDGVDWTAHVSDGGVAETDTTEPPATPPTGVPAAPPPTWVPPAGPPTPARSRRRGRILAWTFAVLLGLVGVFGFVASNGADNHNQKSFAADYSALGQKDAPTETQALDARVAKVKAAYDAYVASADVVFTRHEAVTDQFNEVVSPPIPGLGVLAQKKVPKVISAYSSAVRRANARRLAYLHQLALLKALVAR